MPIIVHSNPGRVSGLWGSALIRLSNGKLEPLQIGDLVNKGDLLLTSQDGIVELTRTDGIIRLAVPAESIPELITALDKAEPQLVPAVGLVGDDDSGLTVADRVMRISEQISSIPTLRFAQQLQPALPAEQHIAPELLQPARADSNAVVAVEEGPAVSLRVTAPTATSAVMALTVNQVPTIGEVRKADGSVLAAGMPLTRDDLAGLVYLPPDEYDGRAPVGDFAYTLDDALTRVTRSVQIVVRPVNDAPSANFDQGTGAEDTNIQIDFAGQDVDGSVVAFTLIDAASQGRLRLADGVTPVVTGQTISVAQAAGLVFQPNADFNGDVRITFSAVDDGGRSSAPAQYALTITPVNDAPVARADTLAGVEDTAATFSAAQLLGNDSDVEGDALTIASVTSGPGGTALLNADGTVSFTPALNFNGTATFDYVASDGTASSAATPVRVVVAPVNDVPTALPDTLAAVEDTPVTFSAAQFLANDSDVDGNTLRIASVSPGTGGSAVLNADGSVSFTPNANFNGAADFRYVLTDGLALSASASVAVNVAPVNDVPIGLPDTLLAVEDTPITFGAAQLLGNDLDVEGSTLRIASVTSGTGGVTVLNADGSVSFTPAPNFNGPASFTYTVSDGAALSSAVAVAVNVQPVNDAPVAAPDALNAVEDTVITFSAAQLLGNDSDVDGPTLNIAAVTSGTGGSAVLNANGSVTFTPSPNFNGPASFSYTATDGLLTSAAVTASVSVAAVNDAPVANPDAATTSQNQVLVLTSATLLGNDQDVDAGDTLRISSVQAATNGTVALDGLGVVTFAPTTGHFGPASFTYTLVDSAGATSTTIVNVNVSASGPRLVAPGSLFGLAEGAVSASSAAAIFQADLEETASLVAGVLDTFNPPPGALALPGNVDVFNGGLTQEALSLRAGSTVAFDWSFFNGEFNLAELQFGFNDMLLVVVTDPTGGQQIVQLTSSEQTGLNVNGDAIDATGTFQFTAPSTGDFAFTWLVTNGLDNTKNSSATIASPRFIAGAGSFGAAVPFVVSAESADPNAAASLLVTASGVPANAAFSAGANLGAGIWSFTPAQLIGLEFLPPAGFAGILSLTVSASTLDPISGAVLTTSQQSTVTIDSTTVSTMGTPASNTLVGTAANDHLQGFGGDDNLTGAGGNDLLYGDAGNDVMAGGAGNDSLLGGTGSDNLTGDAGNDRLSGGAGNDSLAGGADTDVFVWSLADRGLAGNPANDIIVDFAVALPGAGGDVLDLRDLLIGEAKSGQQPGNLEQFLDFDTTALAGSTIIRISSAGGFAAGNYAPAAEDQRIVLQGIDLRAGAIFGLAAGAADSEIIQQLLQRGKLVADGP